MRNNEATTARALELTRSLRLEMERINREAAREWIVRHDGGTRLRVVWEPGDSPWHVIRQPEAVLAALRATPATPDVQRAFEAIESAFAGRTQGGRPEEMN